MLGRYSRAACFWPYLPIALAIWACTPRVGESDPAAAGGHDAAPARPPGGHDAAPARPPTGGEAAGSNGETAEEGPSCLVKLASAPPPIAKSLEQCPVDPDSRPAMPEGRMSFPGTRAPELRIELAQTDAHRAHGLMFRPTLSEDEGMLFSWPSSGPRAFWMKNTCLALDMLFLDEELFVVGVVEQVPPWNLASRSVACQAAHVLEVRAGWVREFGVTPGRRAVVDAPLPH